MVRNIRNGPVLAVIAVMVVLFGATGSAAASGDRGPKPTIVLVHGAFADASGWNEVSRTLLRKGYPVLAPANPLRGVDSDAAYVRSVLATIDGPIVLVGHSYGGFVLTNAATGNANVKALVYIAAFAPDAGETVGELSHGGRLGPDTLDVRPYPGGGHDGYIKQAVFREIFAADVPAGTAAVMAASQRPSELNTLGQASGEPAWRSIPSWTLVAKDDQVIPAATQRLMAKRAGARVTEVRASHVVMISKPGPTTDVILSAVKGAS